jgi:hypothetical protein
MTNEDRQHYDTQFQIARSSMTKDEYDDWIYRCRWPASTQQPDGIFNSIDDFLEYFNIDTI